MENIGVKVTYRNERQNPIYEKSYSQKEYTEMIRVDLLRLITDIEDAFYQANQNRSKEEWSDQSWSSFCKIKHKILDKAGDIGRLPYNLFEYTDKDDAGLGGMIAHALSKEAM